MDRDDEYRILFEKWTKIMNRLQERESWVRDYGTGDLMYPSEIHTLQAVGDSRGINITGLAERLGITASGVSQMARRLEKKGLVEKIKRSGNDKEILLMMTEKGRAAYLGHERHHTQIQEILNRELNNYDDEQILFLSGFLSRVEEICDEVMSENSTGIKGGVVHE
ncbi:MAG: MarR family transcriptional regulator [Methanomicrobiaceae archaeon]|nr:MarR family transcriptional regulator [Methanomicrobiaceae archaeon]